MKKARESQLSYLFLALVTIPIGLYINIPHLMNGQIPESVMLLFLGLNALLMAYVSPHLFPKDERSKEIMGRTMSVNYFTLFISILLLFLMTSPSGMLTLSATEVLIALFCIMITAIPISLIVFSKRI